MVFLAGARVYKLKRAVRFPYVDFSTVENRREACAAELALNRRTAPQLYFETRAIVRRANGTLHWAGDGETGAEIADWVVVMRRFDQAQRLDAIAEADGLEPRLLRALAAHIADFHARAERRPGSGAPPRRWPRLSTRTMRACATPATSPFRRSASPNCASGPRRGSAGPAA